MLTESISVVAWRCGGRVGRITRGMREILEMINIFIILVVEVISRVYTYVKTYQIITFTYVQFIVYQLNFSRAVKKINEFLLHLLQ